MKKKEKVLSEKEIFEMQTEVVYAITDALREITTGMLNFKCGQDGYLINVADGHQIFITKPKKEGKK
jgi:hypothetical protein